jgi:predicted methyltransferase
MNHRKSLILVAVFGLLIVPLQLHAANSFAQAMSDSINHEDRPIEDIAVDQRRLPLEVLSFAGLEQGMHVFEMEAGGGYYTEIISRFVGPKGSVVYQNPASFDSFLGDIPEKRFGGNRLPNVRLSKSGFDALDAADNSIDLVTWIMGPHELWYSPAEGISLGNPEKTFAEIARILKPGGVFLALDHHAASDSGTEVGGTLHRIREDIIVKHAETSGMKVLETSDMHEHNEDPLDVGVFDPAVRGKTSRFVVLFQK